MNLVLRHLLTGIGLVAGTAAAQDPIEVPTAVVTWTAADRVLTDADTDGTVWATAADWKAGFAADGVTFVPFLGSDAPRSFPTTFAVPRVTVDGEPLEADVAAPALRGTPGARFVRYDRGAFVEDYALSDAGIEQRFGFATLPTRGTLRVDVAVDSAFEVGRDGAEHVFRGARGSFRYGAAVAFDAAGERTAVDVAWNGHGLTLTVPADFVASAVLPLWIDPLIGGVTTSTPTTRTLTSTDIAFDATHQQYLVCWERVFSATDSDVYAQPLDGVLAPVGPQLVIDVSTTSWRAPRTASLFAYSRFLVVAEKSVANTSPFVIGGRIVIAGASPTLQPQVVSYQQPAGFDAYAPDVGGDAMAPGATRFALVTEVRVSATDTNIALIPVNADGIPYGTTWWLTFGAGIDHRPVISNSSGIVIDGNRRWGVAFHREESSGGGHVRFAMVDQTLSPVPLLNDNTRQVSPALPTRLDGYSVASPIAVGIDRHFLITETRTDEATGISQVFQTVFDRSGNVATPTTTVVTGNKLFGVAMSDGDGSRCATVFPRGATVASTQGDVRLTTVAATAASVVEHDAAWASQSTAPERAVAITALGSGGGVPSGYGVAWIRELQDGTSQVACVRYDGIQAGTQTVSRPIGCGGLQIGASGRPVLGEPLSISMPMASGILGYLIGVGVDLPLPGCTACRLGVQGDAVFGASTINLRVPRSVNLVGTTISFQGVRLAPGTGAPCYDELRLSNVLDFTVR